MTKAADPIAVFDRALVARHRERAAARFAQHDFLFAHVAEGLVDRLYDVRRGFPTVLDLGCHAGGLARRLAGEKGIETLVGVELSEGLARRARDAGVGGRGRRRGTAAGRRGELRPGDLQPGPALGQRTCPAR